MEQENVNTNINMAAEMTEGFLHALLNFYVSVYYLDLKKEKYIAIGQNSGFSGLHAEEYGLSCMDDYIRNNICEEDRAQITAISRPGYILERLKKEPSFSAEARSLGKEKWCRYTFMRGADDEHAVIVLTDVTDQILAQEKQMEEIRALNTQLQENQTSLEEASSEQEAQLEEITALNAQLESNQAELEASVAEQEAQIQEITELNAGIEQARKKAEDESRRVSEAYGMIEGLSQDYHTIWLVDKETSKMHLIRSSGKSTIQRAVRVGIDEPLFDPAFDNYIGSCVEPEDRERMHREIAFSEILRQLRENPGKLYAVNYLRRDDGGHVGYHQIAFANAVPQTERNSSSTASAMWIRWSGKSRHRKKCCRRH